MSLSFTFIDLDGLDDFFGGTVDALRLVLFVLALFVAIGVVQVVVDRVRAKVKIPNQGAAADAAPPSDHPGGVVASARANKLRGRG